MRANPLLRIGLMAALAVPIAGCGEDQEDAAPVIRPIRAMQVQTADTLEERWFPGQAKATQEVDLAFEVPGQLIDRPINVGDVVREGDVLARLDPRDYENELAAAIAARDRAKANSERMEQAGRTGAVSQQDVDDAMATYEANEARVRIAEKAVEDSVLRARFDSTVAATYVENFQNVQSKQPVLRLLDTSRVEMWINIPENLISYAAFVQDIRVQFDAFPGREFAAEIKEVSNEASLTTRTFPVNLILDQPGDLTILPGMAGRANGNVVLPEERRVEGDEIPISALGTDDQQSNFVWIIDEAAGTVSKQAVELVRATPRGVIVTGVAPGEWISTAGVNTLVEGQQVRVLAAPDGGAV